MPTVYYSSSSLNDAQHGMGAAASSSRDHSPFSRRDRTRRDRLPISGQVPLALVAESLPIVDQAHPGRMEAVDFAQADDAAQFAGELGGIVSLSEIYCLHPTWVRLIDNRQGFGYKREWNLP